jgi:hypothetical protein
MNGALVAGGILDGTPLVNGAVASSIATLAIDGAGLAGVILGGDTFTIGGETGSPVHTVTSGAAFVVANASVTSVTFTPAIATGGVADNATLLFTSRSVALITLWRLRAEKMVLDATAMGDKWRTRVGGLCVWEGEAEAWLDYADTNQALLLNRLLTAAPTLTTNALVLRTATSKQWYGYALLRQGRLLAEKDTLVKVAFAFSGDGAVLPNFT